MMINMLRSNFGGYSSLSDEERGLFKRNLSGTDKNYHMVESDMDGGDVIIVHPIKCRSRFCQAIWSRMKYSEIPYKRIFSELANHKWNRLILSELKVVLMDAPFVINKLEDIQYAERYNSFFKEGQVVHPVFNEQIKPEVAAEYGWEYGGESGMIKTYSLSNHGHSYDIIDFRPGQTFHEVCEKNLPGFNAQAKSLLECPVFHLRGTPVEGTAAKVQGCDIYLITPSRNKDKLNFDEYPAHQITEIKRARWLSFVKYETDHDAIETSLEDWKKIDPLIEKVNVFTEKLEFVLNEISERIKVTAQNPLADSASTPPKPSVHGREDSENPVRAVAFEQLRIKEGNYSDDNWNNYSAEGTENIQPHFDRDGSCQGKNGSSSVALPPQNERFGAPGGSSTSDVSVAIEKKVEGIKKVKQFLDMIRPDIEQLVLINKRREYLQVNSFMSNFLRLCANEVNSRSEEKHVTLINANLRSMALVSLADIASVFLPVFQGNNEIPVFGDTRTELLVMATDFVHLISDLCCKAQNGLDATQSATCEETAS